MGEMLPSCDPLRSLFSMRYIVSRHGAYHDSVKGTNCFLLRFIVSVKVTAIFNLVTRVGLP